PAPVHRKPRAVHAPRDLGERGRPGAPLRDPADEGVGEAARQHRRLAPGHPLAADPVSDLSLQERYAPQNACFRCVHANRKALHVRGFVKGDEVLADWMPEPHHEAFTGILNGGIIGALLDCHSNWAATYHLMQKAGAETPPCTVTADYAVRLLRPTPSHKPV